MNPATDGESTWAFPAGHPSLDLWDIEHECPMRGGAVGYSLYLAEKGEWPPPAPIFYVDSLSLFARFLRHFWLEARGGFSPIMMTESWPGIGKSAAAWPVGRMLDPYYTLNDYLYDAEVILECLTRGEPMRVRTLDESIATALFSRNWARADQKEMVQNIWAHARNRKQLLNIVAQNARALDWVIRDDVARWYLKIKQRDPRTQVKYGELWHAVRVPVKAVSVGKWGYAAGDVTIFRPGGYLTIPPTPAAVMDAYAGVRDKGLGVEVAADTYLQQ